MVLSACPPCARWLVGQDPMNSVGMFSSLGLLFILRPNLGTAGLITPDTLDLIQRSHKSIVETRGVESGHRHEMVPHSAWNETLIALPRGWPGPEPR